VNVLRLFYFLDASFLRSITHSGPVLVTVVSQSKSMSIG
jgi:hypothetical protein